MARTENTGHPYFDRYYRCAAHLYSGAALFITG